jgi:hypothetical protein
MKLPQGRGLVGVLASLLGLALFSSLVRAQDTILVANNGSGTIGAYTTSGATINASLISGLNGPESIAVSGPYLFIANTNTETIGQYTTSGATVNPSLIPGVHLEQITASGSNLFVANGDPADTIGEYLTSGAAVNAALVSGLAAPHGVAVVGSNVFVANNATGTISEYTTSGVLVNASLISGLTDARFIVASGSNLFVTNSSTGTIGEYTTSGATVNASLISGLNFPYGIAVDGSYLFVANAGAGTISEYTTSGVLVNASLISGLNEPTGIAIVPTTTTYSYVGSPFNECNGVGPANGACPANYASDYIIASATFDAPLGPSLSSVNEASAPNLLAWTIGDFLGYTAFSSSDQNVSAELTSLLFSTDSGGAITGWTMTAKTLNFTKGQPGNNELGTFNPPFTSANGSPEADFLIVNGGNSTTAGWNVGNSAPGTWTETLNAFQGGTVAEPVFLVGASPMAGVSGTISGQGVEEFYEFYWAGGAFTATAQIIGTPNAGASYLFSAGAIGSCNSAGTLTLDASNSFTGTITLPNLSAGDYCIGLDANNSNDPAFTLTFNTPVAGRAVSCDLEGNGNVGVSDVQQMIDEALGTAWPASDLNGDGVINVTDVQIEIDAALNLGCSSGQLNAATQASTVAPRSSPARSGTPGAGTHH